MSTWLPWLLLAAIPVLAVILRLYAGDEPDGNEITHESSSEEDDPGAGIVPAAA